MIKFENTEVFGFEPAIRGMRNPKNSWDRSDSFYCGFGPEHVSCNKCEYNDVFCDNSPIYPYIIGEHDYDLMTKLNSGGPVHAKYRRMITVYVDITAPLYWWKEFDTYKVGTVANSCSTMHKIHDKKFTLDDFSTEHLESLDIGDGCFHDFIDSLKITVRELNIARSRYLDTKDKRYWWQMIQLLPTSYNQKRTVMLNYEVLANIYKWRYDHKLDEWNGSKEGSFCKWIESLPYSELITGAKQS